MREAPLSSRANTCDPILYEVRRHLVGLPRKTPRARSLSFFSALVWGRLMSYETSETATQQPRSASISPHARDLRRSLCVALDLDRTPRQTNQVAPKRYTNSNCPNIIADGAPVPVPQDVSRHILRCIRQEDHASHPSDDLIHRSSDDDLILLSEDNKGVHSGQDRAELR